VADSLLDTLAERLPFSPQLYPDGQITDLPEAFFASEIIRERLLEHLHQEVPHAAAVRIEAYDDAEPLVRIAASLLLDRDSQKGIVIGRGGQMLKRIGSEARGRIEKRLGRRVFLDLQVKVRAKWRDNAGILRDLGL
jgi:GTP-binding protein Era